ncbi:MAG: hypothetical protein UZ17_ACD001002924 [Acidobacteria bacterium OLB17]|nr:MAG: hypothetical protein UZ17_ACD001002924 [Acidobacteria bacterium OLB17]
MSQCPHALISGKYTVKSVPIAVKQAADIKRGANQLNFEGRIEAASINQTAAMEAARLRMVSTVVTGFFRDMDRRLEEMKPKY